MKVIKIIKEIWEEEEVIFMLAFISIIGGIILFSAIYLTENLK